MKKSFRSRLAGICVTALALSSSAATELKNGAEFSLEEVPENLTVKVKRGGSVRFLVEENATTGYQWEATYAANECTVVLEHRAATAAKGLCGAPGKVAVSVTKNAAVQSPSLVELSYRRSWEKNVKPAKTVRLVLYTIPGEQVDFRYPASRTLNMLKAECKNRGIELVDWHVHIRGGLTPEMAAEREKACGFRQSAMRRPSPSPCEGNGGEVLLRHEQLRRRAERPFALVGGDRLARPQGRGHLDAEVS